MQTRAHGNHASLDALTCDPPPWHLLEGPTAWPQLLFVQELSMDRRVPPPCVIVMRFSAAGDIVLTHGALAALAAAWPQHRIVFATHARFAKLMEANPHVHAVVGLEPHESVWAYRRRLQACMPEAVLDLHGKARGAILRWLLRGTRQARWHKRSWQETLAVRFGGARYAAQQPIAQRYHAAVEALVGRSLPPEPLRYFVSDADLHQARTLLQEHGYDLQLPIVGLSPGAMWATKRWPVGHFAELAGRLHAVGCQVVLTGSPAEQSLHAALQQSAPMAHSLAGKLDLGTLGGVLASLRAFVANDSGPMHMARALGVPTLAVFGSTDPGQFDFSHHALLYANADCGPCSFHGLNRCPRGHLKCLHALDVASAWQLLLPLLDRGRVPFAAA